MQLEEFRADFLAETAAWAAAGNTFRHFSFVELAVDYLSDAGEVSDFESCYYRGVGRRSRTLAIDGYAFDEADGSLRVFLAEPSFAENAESLIRTEALALFGRLRWLVEEILEGGLIDDLEMSAPAYDFASSLLQRREDISRNPCISTLGQVAQLSRPRLAGRGSCAPSHGVPHLGYRAVPSRPDIKN